MLTFEIASCDAKTNDKGTYYLIKAYLFTGAKYPFNFTFFAFDSWPVGKKYTMTPAAIFVKADRLAINLNSSTCVPELVVNK